MSEECEQQAQALRTQVCDELKDFFHDQFRDLKRDIQADGEWATESIRKKVRQDNIVTFKSLHNRKQYNFNTEIDHLLDCIQKAVALREATKTNEFITRAMAKIKHINKLICLADGSSAGWATVLEYERSEVASDDEDDRRIRKAEERAKSKLEKARPSSNSNFDHSFQFFRNFRRGTGRPPMAGNVSQQQPVVCHKCGQTGHISTGCGAFYGYGQRPMGTDVASAAPNAPATQSKPEDSIDVFA